MAKSKINAYVGYDYPSRRGFVITPADGTELPQVARKLWLNTSLASLTVTLVEDAISKSVTYLNVPAGDFNKSVICVWATGTTGGSAANIIGEC